jgi:dephospho-CoA kinase
VKIIGVTGGIGSGKTTVSGVLADLGAKVINADHIARKVVARGEKALDELTEHFGKEILTTEGSLDRKKLGHLVFNDPKSLEFLNKITHKYIAERIIQEIEEIKSKKNTEIIVLDVPIPIEHGFIDVVDTIWALKADKEFRIDRIMKRNGLTREEAISRINAQISDEEYERIADEIIYNNGDVVQLEKDVVRLLYQG